MPIYSDEELEIIQFLERALGRELSQQEINLALDQARAIGNLDPSDPNRG